MLILVCLVLMLNIAEFAVSGTDLLASRHYCGYQHTDDYISNNRSISIDEFPWIAQILYSYDRYRNLECTGSLINNRYVLTAAHCLILPSRNATAVRLGDYDVTRRTDCVTISDIGEECSDPVEEFDIEEKITHRYFSREYGLNDIGLARLSRSVVYSEYIRPICLPLSDNPEIENYEDVAVSGWGLVNRLGLPTTFKKKIIAKLTPNQKCKEMYMNFRRPVTQFHICATDSETYTCEGDFGGPLMISIKNQWEQIGLLTFAKECGSGFPSVYLNIAKYLKWIKKQLKP